jgi:multiple sugar transport system ATP-binding protein
MATLEVRGIGRQFAGHRAVDDVSIEVADGELLVLLGPSGCGKSTLLRTVAGLEQATEGDVLIGGRVVTGLRPKDRDIAMVFQNYALYPHLTVFKNIAFPLRVKGTPDAEVKERVRWAADLVDITRLLERKPRQTSGGERQRTALARSLVRQTAVLLLDEPLSNLDAKMRNTAREELRHFQRRVGVTAIHVTHDQTEAMGLGDRIVVMDQGRVRQIGTPEEIYRAPADTFVATFIGSPPMNVVNGGEFWLGFRPEHFLPRGILGGETDLMVMPFRLQRDEYLGGERLVYGTLGGALLETKAISRLPSDVPFDGKAGDTIDFAVRRRDIRRFDLANGRALGGTV